MPEPIQSPADIARQAIGYILRRVQSDADLRYDLLDTEALERLVEAYAALSGVSRKEIETFLRERAPRSEASVVVLRRRVSELEAVS